MTLSEFTKGDFEPPHQCPYWVWKKKASSPLGNLKLTLMLSPGDKSEPDQRMFELAEDLIAFVQANSELVIDIAFASYRTCLQRAPDWLEFSDVPLDLSRDTIIKYLDPGVTVFNDRPNLYIDESVCQAGGYTQSIGLRPQWDDEHGLSLHVQDHKIIRVNMEKFEIKDGLLIGITED
ncbi:MAG TPA: hypothetical protein VM680_09605 [Verrucomicrobiae bacterium]|nr:hypothetical protein [Verrucomicrobiae bacterium]